MKHALENPPINLDDWIEKNKATLKPPIGNRQIWKGSWETTLVMMVGGPNYRPDYHDDPGEELFIQLRGDATLKLIDPASGERSEVIVREGEMYLLPSHVRHSPQRPEGCIGLVIERYRQPGEVDALEWYDEKGCLEFRGEFLVKNIEEDLAKVQAAWKAWSINPDRLIPTTWRVGMPVPT
ncbi:3-hydroxyanthranilate 3,4-dioxygenase [Bradyrhizobium sp. WSM1253]|uniref:3-hydroxyanthranilate 3,4-dioxygenase n=1 Tax=Bradyrhizobium sp. WSM1253 TaxID=319003 RepID=UPI00025D2CE6|nr:3-hydroxyanthranilate 3,4-dioxygenase [Bradyrhizobium sp. WSM1253]EIG62166.1 3-hydroxyanthranilate 3,4-dioxygenase [Bradyrhizobium sp. WSM1253]